MEKITNIAIFLFVVVVLSVIFYARKGLKKLAEKQEKIKAVNELLNRENIELKDRLKSREAIYNSLNRRHVYSLMILNIINKEWLKSIAQVVYDDNSEPSFVRPTMTFKYDLNTESYTVKPIFSKTDISKDLNMLVSTNGKNAVPLHILVTSLNIGTSKPIENGGTIDSLQTMYNRINTLNNE
jgi:hypothetical protein